MYKFDKKECFSFLLKSKNPEVNTLRGEIFIIRFHYNHSKKASGYSTIPVTNLREFSRNSIAMKASSGTSNGAVIPQYDAFLKPNFG